MPTVETVDLRPGYTIGRLLKGGWQLSGGHGSAAVERERAVADMAAFVAAGVNAFDCADIYTGVEELIGAFLRRADPAVRAAVKVHTKFVPDLDALATLDRAAVARVVDRSLARLGVERLDLVQFHWWDYAVPRWLETAGWLRELQREGKIDLLGGTNFDAAHAAALIDEGGIDLATMQVQYSLLDARPEGALAELCARTGMRLLCYGAVAGGFLSERWLGAPEPPGGALPNRSLVKYKLIIDEFGGWALFQELLRALKAVAERHGVGIANVATRWVLDRPGVAGLIVGARYADRLADNLRVFGFALDDEDRAQIEAVRARRRGPAGEVYALERDRAGPHGRIMRYNLNTDAVATTAPAGG